MYWKFKKNIGLSETPLNPEKIPTIYNPNNAYKFIINSNKYKRSSIKKNLNTLIRYLRFVTKNPYLKYDLPIGIGKPVKLKHIVTEEEMKLFHESKFRKSK